MLGFLFVVQLPAVQKQMANEFTSWIANEYQVNIQSDKIKLGILSGLQWDDVLLLDSKQDTLLYVEEVKVQASNLSLNHFKKIYLEGLQIHYQFGDSILDAELYRYIEPFFNSDNQQKTLLVDNFLINGGRLDFGNETEQRSFREIDLYLKDCQLSSETSFVLSNFQWEQYLGQKHQLEAKQIRFSKQGSSLESVLWKSGSSIANIDFQQHKDTLALKLHQLKIDKKAVEGLFYKWPENLEFDMSTSVHSVGDSLWTENIQIQSAKGSIIDGAFGVQNWTNFKNWNYTIQAKKFNLHADEWLWIETLFKHDYLLSKLGTIRSSTSLQGTLSDLNLNISLHSDQGYIESDLFINISDSLAAPVYNGDLVLKQFNLSPFIADRKVGKVDAKVSVDGEGFDLMSFDTEVHGRINSIDIGGYDYNNITLDGRLQPNHFKGKSFVADENLEVDFSGEIDFSKEKPVMDFVADIIEANLVKLNWYDKAPIAKLSSLVELNLVGNKWQNIEGDIGVYHTTVETYDNYYHFNDVLFSSEKLASKDVLKLTSDFANANLEGSIDIPNLFSSFLAYLNPHFPLLNKGSNQAQNFVFTIDLFNTSALTNLLMPQLNLGDGAHISGNFNNRGEGLSLALESPNLGWDKWLWRDLNINSKATPQHWEIGLTGAKLDYNNTTKIENIEIDQVGNYGDWRYAMAWTSTDSVKFDGILKGEATVDASSLDVSVEQSQFYFADTLWTFSNQSGITMRSGEWNSLVRLSTKEQKVDFKYFNDQAELSLQNVEFENFSPWFSKSNTEVIGRVNGDFEWKELSNQPILISSIQVDSLLLNNHLFGDVNLSLGYDEQTTTQYVNGGVFKNNIETIDVFGGYMPFVDENNFSLEVDVLSLNIAHIESYLESVFDALNGNLKGQLNFYGNIKQPEFDGLFDVHDLDLSIPYLNTRFIANDSAQLHLSDQYIEFKDLVFSSEEDGLLIGEAELKGELLHQNFSEFELGLILEADSFLCLNTDAYRDEPYYGRALATGDVSFMGPTNSIAIQVNAKTQKGTEMFIPLDDEESIEELSFIHFIDKDESTNDMLWTLSDVVTTKSALTVDLNLEFDESAEVNIIFDETLGDKINARGTGFLNLGVNKSDDIYMFGEYTVDQGDYLFTLQNFANKKFEIEKGAQLLWDGDPYKAQMDLNAIYKVNTNIKELAPEYNRNTDVECRMTMTGDLLQPEIEFDIQIPKGDDMIKRILDERTNTEEKKTQQFLSLLVLNSFMSTDELENTDVDYLSSTLSTGTEVLSNQLSNWMSQFTDRVDLGFKYQPSQGDTLSNKEFELLLNNMKVNDRIMFNGNIGTLPAQNKTRFIGDFKVEYRLSEDGKLRLLAFRNLEESFQLQNDESNYTTGLGLFYRDEFDDFTDLWSKFLGMFKKK